MEVSRGVAQRCWSRGTSSASGVASERITICGRSRWRGRVMGAMSMRGASAGRSREAKVSQMVAGARVWRCGEVGGGGVAGAEASGGEVGEEKGCKGGKEISFFHEES